MPVDENLAAILGVEKTANKDKANGYPSLDANKLVPVSEIPDLSGSYLPLSGGTMSGNLVMGLNTYIQNLGLTCAYLKKTGNYTVTKNDFTIDCNAFNNNITLTFGSTNTYNYNQIFLIRKMDSSAHTVTLTPAAGQTFNGYGTYRLTKLNESIIVQSDFSGGSGNWQVFGDQSFLTLNDSPLAYSGVAGSWVTDTGANGLQFQTPTFLSLTDVPPSYVASGSKMVRVNAGATALEFITDQFIGKSDTPANYSGAGSQLVRVNAGATALEFVDPASTTAVGPPGALTPNLARYTIPGWAFGAFGSYTPASGVIIYVPIFVPATTTYNQMSVSCSSGSTSTVDCWLYAWNNGLPGAKLYALGTFSWSSAYGVRTVSASPFPITLNRGFYFYAVRSQNGGPTNLDTIAGIIDTPIQGNAPQLFTGSMYANYFAFQVTAALADPAPAPTSWTGSYPCVYFQEHA